MSNRRASGVDGGRLIGTLLALGALVAGAGVLRLAVGTSQVGLPEEAAAAVLQIRGYRLALGVVVGAALAMAGVGLQTLLRNPLAEPYILGLSTGAAAGLMAEATLGLGVGPGYGGAVAGAALSMGVVYALGRRHGLIDPLGLLLAGVVVSTINGSLIMLMHYLAGPGQARDDLLRWMMGYLNEGVGVGMLSAVAGVTAGLGGLFWLRAGAMDVATLSDEEARSLGVGLARLRVLLFAGSSVLAACAVMLAGPIAFVGLICPHVARLLLGPGHRGVLPASALLGAALIVLADVGSVGLKLATAGDLLPIGILTALLGGPVFLWLLRPHLGRGDS